eukprot:GHVP01015774.1.p1 GENE.GHVP01015774.1~~GHVP01015774.1.p1  ORF type:complete len:565 (-),score=74.29 GHVP01015774.1:4-1698(-)
MGNCGIFSKWSSLIVVVPMFAKIFMAFVLSGVNATLKPMSLSQGWCTESLEPWMEKYGSCVAYTTCKLGNRNVSLVAGVSSLGSLVGSYSGMDIARIGRRKASIILYSVGLVGLLLILFGVNVWMFSIGRLLLGLCGSVTIVLGSLYLYETAPPIKRGVYNGLVNCSLVIVFLMNNLLSYVFGEVPKLPDDPDVVCGSEDSIYNDCGTFNTDGDLFCNYSQPEIEKWWWRLIMAGIPAMAVTIFIFILLFVFNFETPNWLLLNNKPDKALDILIKIRDGKDVTEEYEATSFFLAKSKKDANGKNEQSVCEFHKDQRARKCYWAALLMMVTKHQAGGVPMTLMAVLFFTKAGATQKASVTLAVIQCLVQLSLVIFLTLKMDHYGRRFLLILGTSIATVGLFIPVIALAINEDSKASTYLSLAGVIIFNFGWFLGPAFIPFIIFYEMFPPHMKKSAIKTIGPLGRMATGIDFFIIPLLTSFVIFAKASIMSFILLLVSIFLIKETRGLSVGESPYFPVEVTDKPVSDERSTASTEKLSNSSIGKSTRTIPSVLEFKTESSTEESSS